MVVEGGSSASNNSNNSTTKLLHLTCMTTHLSWACMSAPATLHAVQTVCWSIDDAFGVCVLPYSPYSTGDHCPPCPAPPPSPPPGPPPPCPPTPCPPPPPPGPPPPPESVNSGPASVVGYTNQRLARKAPHGKIPAPTLPFRHVMPRQGQQQQKLGASAVCDANPPYVDVGSSNSVCKFYMRIMWTDNSTLLHVQPGSSHPP